MPYLLSCFSRLASSQKDAAITKSGIKTHCTGRFLNAEILITLANFVVAARSSPQAQDGSLLLLSEVDLPAIVCSGAFAKV